MKKQPTPTEMELAAEAELAILQRHYRDLENERNAFFSGALAGSKARVIEVLKEESKDLDLTLAVANSTQNQRKDEYVSEKLTDLLVGEYLMSLSFKRFRKHLSIKIINFHVLNFFIAI